MESPPSRVPHFRIGDRVQLMYPLPDVAMNAIGTVASQFLDTPLYNVQFDGQSVLRVVDGRKLALVPRAPARRR